MADTYLEGRGLDLGLAATFRLGVVIEPEIGHELYAGRLSIPYLTRAGVVNIKFRCIEQHVCKDVGCPKYLGLEMGTNIFNTLAFFKDSPHIAICEGEFDAMVLDGLAGVPAVSIPGVRNWKPHYDRCFTDYERVFVFADGDQDGKDFAKRIRSTLDGVTVIQMPDGLDVNGVYQAEGPDGLRKRAGL
jgi:DNA primase